MGQLYTSSRLSVLRECLRKHHLRYVLGLQTPATDVMRFGTIGHSALEAWYRAWMARDTEIALWDRARAEVPDGDPPPDYRLPAALAVIDASDLSIWDRIKLSILIRAYDARWGACDWEVLAVEQEFRYLLGDHEIGGKIDAIIRDRRDGRVYVVEHKTTGADASLGAPYWERLTIDTQVSIYIDGAGILGYEVAGCIYDVLKRPAHEPKLATPIDKREYTKGKGCKGCSGSGGGKAGIVQGRGNYSVVFGSVVEVVACDKCCGTGWLNDATGKPQAPRLHANMRDTDESADDFEGRVLEAIAEAPDAFLMRGTVVRLEHELPLMRQDVLDDIAIAETGLKQRNSSACASYGQMCGYWAICSGTASTDDFLRGPAHPELEAAT
jgi:hypothetical protein